MKWEPMIYNQDCLMTMKNMEEDSVDLVLTSPPYNMNLRIRNGKYCSRQIVKEFSTKYEGFDDNLPIDNFYKLHSNILHELLRISPLVFYNISIVTGSKRAFFKIIGEFNEQIKDIIVWDKGTAQPSMQPGVLNRQSELILVFDKNNAISRQFKESNFDRGTMSDTWLIKRERSKTKNHCAIFPTNLARKVITYFTKEGDTVYDPFMGTGTTGIAAKELRRYFIGSDINKSYC